MGYVAGGYREQRGNSRTSHPKTMQGSGPLSPGQIPTGLDKPGMGPGMPGPAHMGMMSGQNSRMNWMQQQAYLQQPRPFLMGPGERPAPLQPNAP